MSAKKKTVFVIYYSMYGHIEALARAEMKGLEKAGGNIKINLKFFQFGFFVFHLWIFWKNVFLRIESDVYFLKSISKLDLHY